MLYSVAHGVAASIVIGLFVSLFTSGLLASVLMLALGAVWYIVAGKRFKLSLTGYILGFFLTTIIILILAFLVLAVVIGALI